MCLVQNKVVVIHGTNNILILLFFVRCNYDVREEFATDSISTPLQLLISEYGFYVAFLPCSLRLIGIKY